MILVTLMNFNGNESASNNRWNKICIFSAFVCNYGKPVVRWCQLSAEIQCFQLTSRLISGIEFARQSRRNFTSVIQEISSWFWVAPYFKIILLKNQLNLLLEQILFIELRVGVRVTSLQCFSSATPGQWNGEIKTCLEKLLIRVLANHFVACTALFFNWSFKAPLLHGEKVITPRGV